MPLGLVVLKEGGFSFFLKVRIGEILLGRMGALVALKPPPLLRIRSGVEMGKRKVLLNESGIADEKENRIEQVRRVRGLCKQN